MMRLWLFVAIAGLAGGFWRGRVVAALTPRRGRHRGTGRATRIRGYYADHAGRTLLDVWWTLRQATYGYVAVGTAQAPPYTPQELGLAW